jgi:hypothetical protein
MRAFDIENGEVLWRDVLPNNAQATPMSYVSPATRRQYVVITVPELNMPESTHAAEPEAQRGANNGPDSEPGGAEGGWVIAYSLPPSAER